jgi:hypothetical protein
MLQSWLRGSLQSWCLAAACVISCLAACDQRSTGGSTVTPTGHGTDSQLEPEGGFEGESIDELRVRLDRLTERQQLEAGAGTSDPAKCEELCELSKSICEVKSKMCEIADEHVGDDEYQDLCRVAKQRCQRASESCVRCVQHHQRVNQSGGATPTPAGCEGEAPREDGPETSD